MKNQNLTVKERTQKYGNTILRNQEVSAEEATWYLNMYPFTGLSRAVMWLDTNSPEKRFRMTTPVIQEEGQVSYKVMSNPIEKYRERPTSMEEHSDLAKKVDLNPLTLSYVGTEFAVRGRHSLAWRPLLLAAAANGLAWVWGHGVGWAMPQAAITIVG